MTYDDRRALLEAAAAAPSGDNLQPWRVRWDADVLCVTVDRRVDRSLYNRGYRASLIALGALVENIAIAASARSLAADTRLVDDEDLVSATIAFNPAASDPDPLHPAIAGRSTNRRPYSRAPLAADQRAALLASVPQDGRSRLAIVEDRATMRAVAGAAAANDRLLFDIERLHRDLFSTIRWTAAEAERTRDGLFLQTLELGPMEPSFRLMRSWRVARLLRLTGGALIAPRHSYRTFRRSAAFLFLAVPNDSPRAHVEGGRRVQRLWLTATALGLSVQPMNGTLYLMPYRSASDVPLSETARRVLARGARTLGDALSLAPAEAPIMLLRVGRAGPPSARSLRRPLG